MKKDDTEQSGAQSGASAPRAALSAPANAKPDQIKDAEENESANDKLVCGAYSSCCLGGSIAVAAVVAVIIILVVVLAGNDDSDGAGTSTGIVRGSVSDIAAKTCDPTSAQ